VAPRRGCANLKSVIIILYVVCISNCNHPHAATNARSLYRFGQTDNAICPCEEEEQTADHLIVQCKKLHNQRNEMKKTNKKQWWQLAYE